MRIGRINGYTPQCFDATKAEDLKFIEICCNNGEEAERMIAASDSIVAEIQRTGIDVSCVGRWNHDIQQDGKLNQEKLALYLAQLDAAIKVGAKTFVCGCNYDASVSLFKNYCNALALFGTLTERAAGSHTRIAIQNCNWNNFIVGPEEWKIILGENPALGIKFDASHAYNRHSDYLAELSEWGERVYHVHIKGTVHAGKRGVDDPPAGMDDIHWRSLFAILYSRAYDGDLSIEPHSRAWMGERGTAGVRFTRDFIRQFIV